MREISETLGVQTNYLVHSGLEERRGQPKWCQGLSVLLDFCPGFVCFCLSHLSVFVCVLLCSWVELIAGPCPWLSTPALREATIRINLRWAVKLKRLVETLTPATLCAFALPLLLWILTFCLPCAQVPRKWWAQPWVHVWTTIAAVTFVVVVNYLMTVNKRTELIFRVCARVHPSFSLDKSFFG